MISSLDKYLSGCENEPGISIKIKDEMIFDLEKKVDELKTKIAEKEDDILELEAQNEGLINEKEQYS